MLVLHPTTQVQLERIVKAQPHALLLTGSDGMGKGIIAQKITSDILETKLDTYPYVRVVKPDEKSIIAIEAIRNLQQFIRLKTPGKRDIRRIIIIEHADRMTNEAQNAFLRLLEEPPADTMIILSAASVQNLLPTIRSRVQEVTVLPPKAADLQAHFTISHPQESVAQAYFLSGGLPGLMSALLDNNQQHPLRTAVLQAKTILQQDNFEKLASIDVIKQKSDAVDLCQALQRIAQAGIGQAALKHNIDRLKQWQRILIASVSAQTSLYKNTNIKLTLTHLMLQLS